MMPMMLAQQVLGLNKQILAKAGVPPPAHRASPGATLSSWARRWWCRASGGCIPWNYTWSDFNSWIYANGLAPRQRRPHQGARTTRRRCWRRCNGCTTRPPSTQLFRPRRRPPSPDFDSGQVRGGGAPTRPAGMRRVRYPQRRHRATAPGCSITHFPIGPSNARKQIITYANVYGLIALKTSDAKRVAAAAEVAGLGRPVGGADEDRRARPATCRRTPSPRRRRTCRPGSRATPS